MKFFWKAFVCFFVTISVAFAICGTWIIEATFNNAYNREIENKCEENDTYRYTLVSAVSSGIFSDVTDNENKKYVLERVFNNGDKRNNTMTVWSSDKEVLFTNCDDPKLSIVDQAEPNKKIYGVIDNNGVYELHVISCANIYDDYYLETISNLEYIYRQYDEMTKLYHYIMIIILVVSSIICTFISYFLTNRITNLSRVARRIAQGDLNVRAKVRGRDEVATLASNFNKMTDRLNEKMEEIEEGANNQKAFTSAFAHELKTPLTSIIGYAELLKSMVLDQEETMNAANYIYSQGKRLESLSYKLMELFFVQEQKLEFVNNDAKHLLTSVYDLVEILMNENEIKLVTSFDKGKIYGEKDLLVSLFANIIDNARKASEKGSKIFFTGINLGTSYQVTVRDMGMGIPEEEIRHLKEAFYMVDKSRARKQGGAGLGMTLCNEIVRLHEATWDIDSEVGKGTTMTITFDNKD